MKKTYGRKVYIAIIITAVLICIVMAVGGGIMTLSDLPERAGEEKMSMVQILTALMRLVAETYAAGMLIL